MIVDLHIHTNLGSICSQLGPEELLERAQEMGIDAICITEHHSHRGANKMVEFAAGSGYPVFRGVEIYTELGDMLVYGLKRETRYHLTTFQELVDMAVEDGAVIIPAHPCRGWGRKHKHAHIFPRYLNEPAEPRGVPVWMGYSRDEYYARPLDLARDKNLMEEISNSIQRRL